MAEYQFIYDENNEEYRIVPKGEFGIKKNAHRI